MDSRQFTLPALIVRYSEREAREAYETGRLGYDDWNILNEALTLYRANWSWLRFSSAVYWRVYHSYLTQEEAAEILAVVGPWYRYWMNNLRVVME